MYPLFIEDLARERVSALQREAAHYRTVNYASRAVKLHDPAPRRLESVERIGAFWLAPPSHRRNTAPSGGGGSRRPASARREAASRAIPY